MSIFKAPKDTSQQMSNSLPDGRAWGNKNNQDSNTRKLINSLAPAHNKNQQTVEILSEEAYIRNTVDLLTDWEESVGLPDECLGIADSIEQRRSDVIIRLRKKPFVTLSEFQELVDDIFPDEGIILIPGEDYLEDFEYTFEFQFGGIIGSKFLLFVIIPEESTVDRVKVLCLLRKILRSNAVPVIYIEASTTCYMPLISNLNVVIGITPIIFKRGSIATYFVDGLLVVADPDAPRFEDEGLLLEGSNTNTLTYSGDQYNAVWNPGIGGFWNSARSFDIPSPSGNYPHVTKHINLTGTQVLFARVSGSYAVGNRTPSIYIYVPSGQGISDFGFIAGYNDAGFTNVDAGSTDTKTEFDQWVRVESPAIVTLLGASVDFNITADGSASPLGFVFYTSFGQEEALAFASSYMPSTDAFVSRASTATYYDSSGVLQIAAINTERIAYNPNNLAAQSTQLFEDASTNLLIASDSFNFSQWAKLNATISTNVTTAPDSSNAADKLVENTGLSVH